MIGKTFSHCRALAQLAGEMGGVDDAEGLKLRREVQLN
jgi:hypothetical protein